MSIVNTVTGPPQGRNSIRRGRRRKRLLRSDVQRGEHQSQGRRSFAAGGAMGATVRASSRERVTVLRPPDQGERLISDMVLSLVSNSSSLLKLGQTFLWF